MGHGGPWDSERTGDLRGVASAPIARSIMATAIRARAKRDSSGWATTERDLLERHGAKGGKHSSGSSLVDVMTALLAPIRGAVYDPACGSAVFLAEA